MEIYRDYSCGIWALSIVQISLLVWVIYLGRRTKRRRQFGIEESSTFNWHRYLAVTYAVWTLFSAAIIDSVRHTLSLPLTPLFWGVHLPLVAGLIVSGAFTFVLNGRKHPAKHRVCAWIQAAFSVGTAASGGMLVFQLVWLHAPPALIH